jgi:hypothetical protein
VRDIDLNVISATEISNKFRKTRYPLKLGGVVNTG